jgi:hypothetical protein
MAAGLRMAKYQTPVNTQTEGTTTATVEQDDPLAYLFEPRG